MKALTFFDDGNGLALFAGGGSLPTPLSKWTGSAWEPMGNLQGFYTEAVATFDDDGDGPNPARIYAGGSVSAPFLVRWNGSSWDPLPNNIDGPVRALLVFDDGTGAALYVGGDFSHAGAVNTNRIAKWNGSSWSNLGSAMSGENASVRALATFDDGNGPALFAGGNFQLAGGVQVQYVAKWNGKFWSNLGGNGVNGTVNTLAVNAEQPGNESLLCVGGNFTMAATGGLVLNHVAAWNGLVWSALGAGTSDNVFTLTSFDDDGAGPNASAVYVGGTFATAGGLTVNNIARWNGTAWSPLGPFELGTTAPVFALLPSVPGGNPTLYAGGAFTFAGGASANKIAKWSPMGAPTITNQPSDMDGAIGQSAVFTVAVTGSGTVTFQWRHNGANLNDRGNVSGSSSNALTINPISLSDAGTYDVYISNGCGTTQSNPAILSLPAPRCPPDVTGNGFVNVDDLLGVINGWGPCP